MKKREDVFTGTQVGVIIEEFRGQLKLFGDGQEDLRKKVDDVRFNQARTLERVTGIELLLKSHDNRLSRLESAVLK